MVEKSNNKIIFWLIIITGLFLRWYELGAKPMHHDEAQHAMYGLYTYDFPHLNYYKYDPMLHGPVLYNLVAVVYTFFGVSEFSARVLPALLGSLFIFAPLLFRRFFSERTLLLLTGAIALSPSLIYWSRFLIHDYLVITAQLLMLYGVVLAKSERKALFVLLSVAVQYCIKANVFVTLALIFGYLFFEFLVFLLMKKARESHLFLLLRHLKNYPFQLFFALAVSTFAFCYIYSGGFRYEEGILDGLYRKVFPYWLNQHAIQRIDGPFAFNLLLLSAYELPFMLLVGLSVVLFYRRSSKKVLFVFLLCEMVTFALTCFYSFYPINLSFWGEIFKLKNSFDLFVFLTLAIHSVIFTFFTLRAGRTAEAFLGYLFFASFWSYSYLGEKVPWLAVYPHVTGLIFLACYFDRYFREFPLKNFENYSVSRLAMYLGLCAALLGAEFCGEELFLGFISDIKSDPWHRVNLGFVAAGVFLTGLAAFNPWLRILGNCNLLKVFAIMMTIFHLREAVLTNFVYAGHARELMSQVHTTIELDNILRAIRREANDSLNPNPFYVHTKGDPTWPTNWYLDKYHLGQNTVFQFQDGQEKDPKTKYIFRDYKDEAQSENFDGFERKRITLNGWFVPDYSHVTLKKFLHYAVNHEPWNDPGYSYVNYYRRNNS